MNSAAEKSAAFVFVAKDFLRKTVVAASAIPSRSLRSKAFKRRGREETARQWRRHLPSGRLQLERQLSESLPRSGKNCIRYRRRCRRQPRLTHPARIFLAAD